jgi:hypothetical protein
MASPNVTEEENCPAQSGCSESHARHVLQPKWTLLDHPVPLGTAINCQHHCTLFQDTERRAVRLKQPELLQRGVVLLQDNSRYHSHRDVQTLVQNWGWEVLAHPPYSPGLASCLFASVNEHLRGKQFESWDDVNTAVTASLYRLSEDEYAAATDGKYLWTVLVITVSTEYMCKRSGISLFLLSYILLSQ